MLTSPLIATVTLTPTLAASDHVAIWIAAATMLLQIGLTVFVGLREKSARSTQRKVDEIERLQNSVADAAEQRVDQRIDATYAQLSQRIDHLAEHIGALAKRLERGDAHFDHLRDQDAAQQQKVLIELSNMREWMHGNFATRKQVDELKGEVGKLWQRMEATR